MQGGNRTRGSHARSRRIQHVQVYGAALATLATLQIPYRTVTPPVWKKAYRLIGCDKDESRARALELFPTAIDALRLKKHHGRADALLMAEYLRSQCPITPQIATLQSCL